MLKAAAVVVMSVGDDEIAKLVVDYRRLGKGKRTDL